MNTRTAITIILALVLMHLVFLALLLLALSRVQVVNFHLGSAHPLSTPAHSQPETTLIAYRAPAPPMAARVDLLGTVALHGPYIPAGGSSTMGAPGYSCPVMQYAAPVCAATQPAGINFTSHPTKRPGAAARVYMREAAASPDQAQAAGAITFPAASAPHHWHLPPATSL